MYLLSFDKKDLEYGLALLSQGKKVYIISRYTNENKPFFVRNSSDLNKQKKLNYDDEFLRDYVEDNFSLTQTCKDFLNILIEIFSESNQITDLLSQ